MKCLFLLVALMYLLNRVCECEAQTLQDPVALDVSVAIQQQAVLTCTVQYTGTVPPNITIMKAVGTLSSTTTSTMDGMTTLTITAAELSDSGQYICNVILGSEERSTTFNLTVRDEFAFTVTPQNILNASLGSVVTFHCRPNQGEVAFWRKDGTTLLNSFSNTNSITITDIGFEDAGVYTCVVVVSGSRIEEASARLTVSDDLFISIPQDQLNLTLRSTATILCNPSQGMVAWEKNGVPLQSELDARITVNRNLTIMNVTFADIGVYTCLVAVGDREYNMSARLSIQGYVPPYVPGTVGYGSVSTSDQQLIQCSVTGYPGPVIIYWQTEDGQNVSNTTTTVRSGPFVNVNGELDLSRTTITDSGFYRCFGVDVTGNSASQLFLVEVVIEEGISLWQQWYFILLYCVVGAVLVGTVVLLLWFAFSVRDACCMKVSKVVRVRRKPKRTV